MPTHVVRGQKTLQMYGFPVQTYGKIQSAIILIQRRESKMPAVKYRVLIHSACPCKNYAPKCSQTPHELVFIFST